MSRPLAALMIGAQLLATSAHSAQDPAAAPMQVSLPALAPGSVWLFKDSAACENSAIVLTRNVKTGIERDREEIALGIVTTELEREVTLTAGSGKVEGFVAYAKAVLSSQRGDSEQPLAVQGKKFPFAVQSPAPASTFIKAEGGARELAITANDRLSHLLASPGGPVFRVPGSDAVMNEDAWAAISGRYVGPVPTMKCALKQSSPTVLHLECPTAVDGYESRAVAVRLATDESGTWLASADVTSRRTKETRSRAATPDEEVVTTEVRDCKVRTTQTPVAATAVNMARSVIDYDRRFQARYSPQ